VGGRAVEIFDRVLRPPAEISTLREARRSRFPSPGADKTLAVSDPERRLNLVIPLTAFRRKIFVLARKSRGCAEAYIIWS